MNKGFIMLGCVVLTAAASCHLSSRPEATSRLASGSIAYGRAVLEPPDDLFERVHVRMQQPYILAGEDVEILHFQLETWFARNADEQAVAYLQTLPGTTLAALNAFTKYWKFPNHPHSAEKLRERPAMEFAADRED